MTGPVAPAARTAGVSELPDPRSSNNRVRAIRARLAARMRRRRRSLVVLAVDGIPEVLARRVWGTARICRLCAEFPTTSASCWLSAVTGLAPVEHGALGYWQRFDREAPARRVFDPRDVSAFAAAGTVFDDATAAGYEALCLDGDLAPLPGAWRDRLLHGARTVAIAPLYAAPDGFPAPEVVLNRLRGAIEAALGCERRVFLWCYLDVDLYIHHHGYDARVMSLLAGIEVLARDLSAQADVVACSDHGLIPTENDAALAARIASYCADVGVEMAGAGRTRWFHLGPGAPPNAAYRLAAVLGSRARLFPAGALFDAGPYRARAGDLVAVARGVRFLTEPGYDYDHGSWQRDEVFVPFALWSRG